MKGRLGDNKYLIMNKRKFLIMEKGFMKKLITVIVILIISVLGLIVITNIAIGKRIKEQNNNGVDEVEVITTASLSGEESEDKIVPPRNLAPESAVPMITEQVDSVKDITNIFSLLAWLFIYNPLLGFTLTLFSIIIVVSFFYILIKVLGIKKIGKFEFGGNNINKEKTEKYSDNEKSIQSDILFLLLEQAKFLQKIIPLQNVILHEQLERVERTIDQILDIIDNSFVDFLNNKKGPTLEIYEDKDYFAFLMFKNKIEAWTIDEIKFYLKKNSLMEKTDLEFRDYTDNIYQLIKSKIQERVTKAFKFDAFTQKELIDLFCNLLSEHLHSAVYEVFLKAKEIKQEYVAEMEKDLHTFYDFAKTIYERQGWNYELFRESFEVDLDHLG